MVSDEKNKWNLIVILCVAVLLIQIANTVRIWGPDEDRTHTVRDTIEPSSRPAVLPFLQKIAVPAYFKPGDVGPAGKLLWEQIEKADVDQSLLKEGHRTVRMVVINPENGPIPTWRGSVDTERMDAFRKVARSSQSMGLIVLGYVATWWADPSLYDPSPPRVNKTKLKSQEQLLDIVKADIAAFYKNYDINGIYLDQVPATADRPTKDELIFYEKLHDYIKTEGSGITSKMGRKNTFTTVFNAGTTSVMAEEYMKHCDVLVNFEGYYKKSDAVAAVLARYPGKSEAEAAEEAQWYEDDEGFEDKRKQDWLSEYEPWRFWHLVHTTDRIEDMENAVALSKARHAGWIYVTNDSPTVDEQAWDRLPPDSSVNSYWARELAAVRGSSAPK